jgi:hypothetical protein
VGLTGDHFIDLIEEFRDRNIFLSTMGFDSGNYNDHQMEQLADHGNGNYAYIDSYSEAQNVFHKKLLGTLLVIAKDVKVQISFNTSLKSEDLGSDFTSASDDLKFASAVAEYAEILRESEFSDGRRFDDVLEIAQGSSKGSEDRTEFMALVEKARNINP